MKLILLTNDDGVDSPGLLALKQTLPKVGEIVVFAPDHNWSAAGHGKTMHKPLRVQEVKLADGSRALTTNGGPSDCVALAVLGVLPRQPDLVISGINPSSNVAQDMTYSGTVAGALEAHISGIPAMAISLAMKAQSRDLSGENSALPDFGCAAHFAAVLARRMLASGRKDLLLNVNVPAVSCAEITGVAITRLGQRIYRDVLIERQDPRGRKYYWIGGEPPGAVIEEETDVAALAANKISVTPLQLDLTAYHMFDELQGWQLSMELGETERIPEQKDLRHNQ